MVIYASLIAAVKQRPMLFNGITGGILCAGSDAIAQQLEPTSSPQSPLAVDDARPYLAPSLQMINTSSFLDYHRVLSAGLIGVFTGGMVYPTAYARLDALIRGVHFSAVLKKSVLEIATVGIFVNSISMTSRGFFQGEKDASQVIQHVAKELPTVTKNDCLVWLPYNLLAFSLIPAVLRPTTTAIMEATWQTYISVRAHDYTAETESS